MNVADLLDRCTFPPRATPVACALSGGPDSTALVALAVRAGCEVTAHHVDHRLRPDSGDDARVARHLAAALGVPLVSHTVEVGAGPNLEARARDVRRAVLPGQVMTGHTADDQAETVLLRLLRGAGSTGLSAMEPGHRHPILGLRRAETRALCDHLGLTTAIDPTNTEPRFLRNRVRAELLPLLDRLAGRDMVPLLTRTADLARDDSQLLDELASTLDPTDARAVATAPRPLARRAVRRWLTVDGYPPDAATVDRVLGVAEGRVVACEVGAGRRVERSRQRLRVVECAG
ncbi:MAG: tRNA lysidine(34) synthetase TilS [Ilumatobacter sp.]|nr:MAG: tRNA lysidine(34) synthetase TilS [Ilumatobacter sp.]